MRPIRTLFSGVVLTSTLAFASSEGLEYLNHLREQAGLVTLNENSALQLSAQNHSHYLNINETSGHYEDENADGFTGESPSDRAVYAGYYSTGISENVSVGQKDVNQSIDGLMAAIYHRFSFLSLEKDEIGIGVEEEHYTFDMGNSLLNDLCQNHTYTEGSYYYNVCADPDKKIEAESYLDAKDHYKTLASAPDIVMWPPAGGDHIPPAFYDETPDPLPDHDVSGYPISVEFNDAVFPDAPTDLSLRLEDDTNTTVGSIILMDESNDPEGLFTDHQFALFPQQHLEWGRTYYATLSYEGSIRRWCFATQSLSDFGAERVYRIGTIEDINLTVVAGKEYALYFVPQDEEDRFNGYRISYNSEEPTIAFIDWNTLLFSVEGDSGESVALTIDERSGQTITLTLADNDNAERPSQDRCDAGTAYEETTETEELETPDDETTQSSSAGGSPLATLFIMMLAMAGMVGKVGSRK